MRGRQTRRGHTPRGGGASGFAGAPPPSITNNVYWMDARNGITVSTGKVTDIADQSGSGKNIVGVSGTARPAYNTADAAFGGAPSLSGDGANVTIVTPFLAITGTACTVIAAIVDASAVGAAIFGYGANGYSTAGAFGLSVNDSAAGDLNPLIGQAAGGYAMKCAEALATAKLVTLRFDRTASTVAQIATRINGVTTAVTIYAGTGATGSFVSSAFTMFSNGAGGLKWSGSIAQCALWSRYLTDAETIAAERYLGRASGIAL